MLTYLSAPYSNAPDKEQRFQDIMRQAGYIQAFWPEQQVVSPLFLHPAIALVPELGSDYEFWREYSRGLLAHCSTLVIYPLPGWKESVGVQDEIAEATRLGLQVFYVQTLDDRSPLYTLSTIPPDYTG